MPRKGEGTNTEVPDEDILEALHLRDHERLSRGKIAARLGRTRSSICGVLYRVDRDTAKTDNGHLNGTMPPRWWQRKEAAE